MLVFLVFLLWKTELCVSAIVDVKSQINKMAHDHFLKSFLLILLTRRRVEPHAYVTISSRLSAFLPSAS